MEMTFMKKVQSGPSWTRNLDTKWVARRRSYASVRGEQSFGNLPKFSSKSHNGHANVERMEVKESVSRSKTPLKRRQRLRGLGNGGRKQSKESGRDTVGEVAMRTHRVVETQCKDKNKRGRDRKRECEMRIAGCGDA
ncbi:hypothetical protein PIB30_012245 [Stylosanthes scabra]|uniref:Uncharacterized protein n=1 Tax=Stylosanthes scabra TaxID=79078 RepID=A0ABU6V8E3_9FABA|nr:hypothetical protein [Stylosanthes scabra]